MASNDGFYTGRRSSYDTALCTVRYHGPLPGTKGNWLGVEWDDPSRGKHDGTYRGQRMFTCLSVSKTAASFLRPTRPSDFPRTFLEALHHKYGGEDDFGVRVHPIEISGKRVEEVGFEKIRQQQSQLQDLRIAVLDELQLCGISGTVLDIDSLKIAQNDIVNTCPNIVELDIGWSLLESWQGVADLCRPLTKLRVLKVSGARLRLFSLDSGSAFPSAFAEIREVHLNETLLCPAQIAIMLNGHFSQLQILSLAQNQLDNFRSLPALQTLSLPRLETLILDQNLFCDLSSLKSMAQAFPHLRELSLQQNKIDKTGELNFAEMSKLSMFNCLRVLNLSRNQISDFAFVDSLSLLFPSLTSLRISNNPLYEIRPASPSDSSAARSGVPYSFILARIPSLTVLNYTTITTRDREEGEIYYLSTASKEIVDLLEAAYGQGGAGRLLATIEIARMRHPQYETLCRKYDREPVFEQYITDPSNMLTVDSRRKFAAGSLAVRLVETTFYLLTDPSMVFSRALARTIDVYRIKALLSRQFALEPLQFRLIYESEELDPVRDGVAEVSSDWEAWGNWDVDGDVENNTGNAAASEKPQHEIWTEGVLLKDGKKWKKREVEIVDSTKAWGDYIGNSEIEAVTIRIEPFDST